MNYITQHKKQVTYMTVGLLVVLLLWLAFKPAAVPAYRIVAGDYVPSLLVSGEVIAERSTLLSAQSPGRVLDCPVRKGDKITQGQLLVQIDATQLILDRDRAAAAVNMASSQLQKASSVTLEDARANSIQADLARDKAEVEFNRQKALFDAGAISMAQLEEAERNHIISQEKARSARTLMESLQEGGSNRAVLQAELKQRQLDLAEKEMLLSQSRILAPADGELLDLYVSPGELTAVGAQVALVASGAGLKVKIEPDQRYAGLAATGNRAQVWLTNAADTKWEALVAYTEPLANAEQGSFAAELEFTGAIPPLYPGQLVSVQLFGAVQPNAIIIPETYVAVQEGHSGVWLIRDNRARFTPVQLGTSTVDGVVVAGGLQAGDVIGSPEGRREDQRVAPHEENT